MGATFHIHTSTPAKGGDVRRVAIRGTIRVNVKEYPATSMAAAVHHIAMAHTGPSHVTRRVDTKRPFEDGSDFAFVDQQTPARTASPSLAQLHPASAFEFWAGRLQPAASGSSSGHRPVDSATPRIQRRSSEVSFCLSQPWNERGSERGHKYSEAATGDIDFMRVMQSSPTPHQVSICWVFRPQTPATAGTSAGPPSFPHTSLLALETSEPCITMSWPFGRSNTLSSKYQSMRHHSSAPQEF